MKVKKALLIAVPAVLVIAAVAAYLLIGRQVAPAPEAEVKVETDTVTSDDGAATLDIPKGALPEGVTLSDVSVSVIDRGDVEADDAVAAYELKPAGLKLSAPATFTYTAYATDFAFTLPMLVHLREEGSEDEVEILAATESSINVMADTLAVSGELSDFSEVWAVDGLFRSQINSKPDHLVGEDFTFVIWYSPSQETLRFVDQKRRRHEFSIAKDNPWFISGGELDTEGLGYITPAKARFRNGAYEKGMGDHVEYGYFKCDKKGIESVGSAGIDISFTVKHRYETVTGWYSHTYSTQITDSTRQDNSCGESAWVHLGQPYTIICNDGAGPFLSGWYMADPLTGELILDTHGEPVDSETGEAPACP